MSVFSADEYFSRLHRVMSLLDEENIKILQTMKEYGPRNLQKVAKKSGISYSTAYGRVSKLQTLSALDTWVHPSYSKIGLARAMVLAKALPGRELLVRDALKIPGYWLRIFRCTGEPNGYYSLHAVPAVNENDFQHYLDQLVTRGVMKNYQIFWLGESFSPLANFDYYDPGKRNWRFEWKEWFAAIKSGKAPERKQIANRNHTFDKKDLIILKELVKDARITLADLSKMLDITLPATKYRFDHLTEAGYVQDYVITLLPFIPDISDLCEVILDFTDEASLRNAMRVLSETPFVVTLTPIRGLNSITVRTYLPRSEMNNLLGFLASLTKQSVLAAYSYLTLDPTTQQGQTFAYKYYSDESGWHYDNKEYLARASTLVAAMSKPEAEHALYQRSPTSALQ